MVSVVIPAFDEAGTVAASVVAARRHPMVDDVIVVDDGSSDGTADVAEQAGAYVVRLGQNRGKAEAMAVGVRHARHHIIMFLDADVTGHTNDTLTAIMQPVLDRRYEMYVGVHARSTVWLNDLLHFFPIIGGERALTRRLWESVPAMHKVGFQIEIAMNYTSKLFKRGMGFELIRGTAHHTKEKKYGLVVGLWRRIRMVGDVLSISFRLYIVGTLLRVASHARARLVRFVRRVDI
jgi:glycosyltransferase involved in cell wall biosynthesis